MKDFQFITNSHPGYIENLYNDFVKDPESVDTELRKFFEGYDFAISAVGTAPAAKQNGQAATPSAQLDKEFAVFNLIQGYRKRGHLIAKTNPIRERKDRGANLELQNFGLSEADLETPFEAGKFAGLGTVKLKDIIAHLKKAYTTHIGSQFMYITNEEKVAWLTNAIENTLQKPVDINQKKRILQKLNEFLKFVHKLFSVTF